MRQRDTILAYTGLRLAMGMAMLIHGVARIGNIPAFVESTLKTFDGSILPTEAVRLFAWINPFVELLIGLSVILGLATRAGLFAGSLWMTILIFGSTLIQNFNAVGIQLIYSIIFFLLLAYARYNAISLDRLFSRDTQPSRKNSLSNNR